MLMELGLHNRDVAQKVLCSERMRVDAANITCSIIVLDRQWSSATGLPAHFRESTFEQNFQEAVRRTRAHPVGPYTHVAAADSSLTPGH
jgi:hypothetical protein